MPAGLRCRAIIDVLLYGLVGARSVWAGGCAVCMGWWVRGVAAAGMRRGGAAPRGLGAASQAGLDRAMQYGMLFAGVASVK
ncbi:hypothetical protein EI541_07665 [Xanthomonas citri pv. eucalyptorum]|nr:hypothetical protein EI541_07665 [Xanthomonas axonopodis pv. eucalyptorum]